MERPWARNPGLQQAKRHRRYRGHCLEAGPAWGPTPSGRALACAPISCNASTDRLKANGTAEPSTQTNSRNGWTTARHPGASTSTSRTTLDAAGQVLTYSCYADRERRESQACGLYYFRSIAEAGRPSSPWTPRSRQSRSRRGSWYSRIGDLRHWKAEMKPAAAAYAELQFKSVYQAVEDGSEDAWGQGAGGPRHLQGAGGSWWRRPGRITLSTFWRSRPKAKGQGPLNIQVERLGPEGL